MAHWSQALASSIPILRDPEFATSLPFAAGRAWLHRRVKQARAVVAANAKATCKHKLMD